MKGVKNAYVGLQNTFNIKATTGSFSNSLDLTGSTVQFKDAVVLNFSLDTLNVDIINEKTTDAGVTVDGLLLQDGKCDGVNVSGFKMDYDAKINQALLTSSSPSFYNLYLSGFGTTGFVKRNLSGALSIDTSTYENPLTFSAPLLRSSNTISLDTALPITQLTNVSTAGFVKTDSKGNVSIDSTSYENPLTFTYGVKRTGDSVSLNVSGTLNQITVTPGYPGDPVVLSLPQDIDTGSSPRFNTVRLAGLTTNGFLKTSSSNGTLTVDTSTYLTGNETITLSGIITGSGTTAITTAIADNALSLSKLQTISSGAFLGKTFGSSGNVQQIQIIPGTGMGTFSWLNIAGIDYLALATVQDISTTSAPTFNGMTLNGGLNMVNQPITNCKLGSLTSNGFVKTSGGNGTLSIDTNTYLTASGAVTSLQGTANQIILSGGPTGAITLSAPQNIHTAATPTFAGLNLSGLTASSLVATDASKNLTSTVSGLSPGFTGLNLSGLTASSLVATDGSKNMTSTVSGLSPTFTGLTLSSSLTMSGTGASRLLFANALQNRIVELYRSANNDHQYFGFGIQSSTLRYQVGDTGSDHVFYAGASTTASNELFRVRGNGRVGIGTSAPDTTLEINAATGGSLRLTYNDSNGTAATYTNFSVDAAGNLTINPTGSYILPSGDNTIGLGNSSFRYGIIYSATGVFSGNVSHGNGAVGGASVTFGSDATLGLYRIGASNMGVTCGGTKVADFLQAGITYPIQPSFSAYCSGNLSNVTGDFTTYTVIFNTENHDAGSNYNTATGVFTAPVAGRYLLSANVAVTGMGASHTSGNIALYDGTNTLCNSYFNPYASMNTNSFAANCQATRVIQLSAGATITVLVRVGNSTKTVSVLGLTYNSWFSGQLLS